MPTLILPLRCQPVIPPRTVDGPIRRIVTAPAPLQVADRSGRFRDVPRCRLDTGCSTTVMSATLARTLGVPFSMAEPINQPTMTARGQHEAIAYHGEVKVRFTTDPLHVFRLFCVFSEDHLPIVPTLLGLHDILEVFRLTFDGSLAPGAPAGFARLETYA